MVLARRRPEVLSGAAERVEFEQRAACYTLHWVVQGAKLVLYAAEGLSNDGIA